MSLFQHLQLQEVEPEDANSSLDPIWGDSNTITLDETGDGEALSESWSAILRSESEG
jgi:hypothetical protein